MGGQGDKGVKERVGKLTKNITRCSVRNLCEMI